MTAHFKALLLKRRVAMGGPIGSTVTCTGGGPGPGSGGGNAQTNQLLNEIYQLLQQEYGIGQRLPFVDFNTVGTAFTQLYNGSQPVSKAIIVNLSATDYLTITGSYGTAQGKSGVIGDGVVLNPASSDGQAGGSLPVGNIDLSNLFLASSTNSAQEYAVYGEK